MALLTVAQGSFNIELRKLPQKNRLELCRILELGEAWKDLMGIIPDENNPFELKYTYEQIRLIEDASMKQQRPCSEILIEEWSTSGKKRPRITTLFNLLKKAELLRAADYISNSLMEEIGTTPVNNEPLINSMKLPTAPPISDINVKDSLLDNCQGSTKLCQDEIGEIGEVNMFSYDEFYNGTDGFNDKFKIGEGGFGCVYLCTLTLGCQIAVKKLNNVSDIPGLSGRQFRNELLTVTKFSHKNLLPLIGYSSNGPDLCLAYVFMKNGSLEDNLKQTNDVLNWSKRYEIACGTAEGIVHLHTFLDKPLVHRDIKSANILLDENFIPKVGDFGLARHGSNAKNTKSLAMTTTVLGTSAYMAPEAFRGDISVKMDVFSFGVVLLELITGLPPFDNDRDGCDLATHVEEVDDWESLIDKKPPEKDIGYVALMYQIAQKCLHEKKIRPNMVEAFKMLQELNQTQI